MSLVKQLLCIGVLAASTATLMPVHIPAAQAQTTNSINRGPSGLPLPRFVSLKAERVNMRVGPGKQYGVSWRYLRAGLPLEIIQEYDNWRRVRDADGTVGWIHGSLLSGKRTAVTSPWQRDRGDQKALQMHADPKANSDIIAYLKPGVIGEITSCDGAWCALTVKNGARDLKGFATQAELWGAYPNERFD